MDSELLPHLPDQPFDGQEFIDVNQVKWTYDGDSKCWRSGASVREVPLANESLSGLLGPDLKTLLDSVPARGGGFGIITKPLMSVVPLTRTVIRRGTVHTASEEYSGSKIVVQDADFEANQYLGKAIYHCKGVLKGRAYIIYGNDENTLFVQGADSSQAKRGETFEIIEPVFLNQDGAIIGDIELVSYSLDIECLTADGSDPDACPSPGGLGSDVNPAGLNIKVSDLFMDEICFEIPGKAGPQGDKGPQGKPGQPGTGDGPQGEQGDAGLDAPTTPSTLTSVEVVDTNDIHDTAIVGLELDAASGKLYVVKGKVRTPNSNTPAQQIVATAINRGVQFVDAEFGYTIALPGGDPIGEDDVTILHYPKHYAPRTNLADNRPVDTEIVTEKLSSIVNAMIAYAQDKLSEQGAKWDQQIKSYIEDKDEQARTELYDKADDVARCEWGLNLEFCLGVAPNACGLPEEDTGEAQTFPRAPELLGPDWDGATATKLPDVRVPPWNPGFPRYPLDVPDIPTTTTPGVPTTFDYPTGDGTIDLDSRFDLNDRDVRRGRGGSDVVQTDPDVAMRDTPLDSGGLGLGGESEGGEHGPGVGDQDGSTPDGSPVILLGADGSSQIEGGAVVLMYKSGSARRGDTTYTASVQFTGTDLNGNTVETQLEETDEAMLSSWSSGAFENAMVEGAAPVVIPLEGPGSISGKFHLDGEGHLEGTPVVFEAWHVIHPDNAGNAQGRSVQTTMQRDESGNIVDGTGTGTTTCPDCPECPDCLPIIITDVSESTIGTDAGIPITVTGSNISDGTTAPTVKVNGTTVTVDTFTATSVTFLTNESNYGVDQDITITNLTTGESITLPNALLTQSTSYPVIASISPADVNSAGGDTVTIIGTGFTEPNNTGTPSVTIQGVAQTINPGYTDNTLIIGSTTALAPGDADLVVTVTGGTPTPDPNPRSDTAVNGILVF